MAADYLRIATTGVYDTGRYPTPSHARQAVITAAARRQAHRRGPPPSADRGLEERRRVGHRRQGLKADPEPCPPIPH